VAAGTAQGDAKPARVLHARLLGPFSLTLGDVAAGPWARPSARRLVQLVLVSSGHRVGREPASEALFPHLDRVAAANSLSRALSMAKHALAALGPEVAELLVAEGGFISAVPPAGTTLEVDFEAHEQALRSSLALSPGDARDERLADALGEEGTLLEDEPYADWAMVLREALDALRQEARLTLARDRSRGYGRSGHANVAQAWEACFTHDPSCEEAAAALVRAYSATGRHALAAVIYRKCHEALEELGLRVSPALEVAHTAAGSQAHTRTGSSGTSAPTDADRSAGAPRQAPQDEERRLVSVMFAELAGPAGTGERLGPEELREVVGGALAGVVADVESLGGTVTSISGAGLVALFGAPESHEDDPERALRAAFRAVNDAGADGQGLSLRVGIETGPVVAGPLGGGSGAHYGAVGEAVGVAAALQSVARPTSVLVGPATRAATEGLFEWSPTDNVVTHPGANPVVASYLERPRTRPLGQAGRHRATGFAPLVGRGPELSLLRDALREVTAGQGGVVVITGEPGLGKTRLVQECRQLFLAWVGAATGRLPLWLEGRAASYASATPYGLYQQILSGWVGIAPEEGDEDAHHAIERTLKATFGGKVDDQQLALVSQVMGHGLGKTGAALSQLGPGPLQQATFSAVSELISRLTFHGPTVLVLEDLHWADPTSLRLSEQLFSLTKERPLLLVLTRRPEPDQGVIALEGAISAAPGLTLRELQLAPLGLIAEQDLARALLGPGTPAEIVGAVSQGAEGNPLFLEERMASLLETKALERAEDGAWHLDPGAPSHLPEAVERLVRSRVDRLGPAAHHAIVAASVLGPEFALAALGAITDLNGGLEPALSELCSAGLLVEIGGGPERMYRFRHALIQAATYHGLVKRERQRLHARAAWELEESSPGRLGEVAGVLGRHYAMAAEAERAAHYLEMAGDRAANAFANDEAVASYRWAIDLLKGGNDQLATRAAQVSIKLGEFLWYRSRYGEGRTVLQEAIRLVPRSSTFLAATCYRWLGAIEFLDQCGEQALAAFDAAEVLLEESPAKDRDDWVAIWLDVKLLRSAVYGPLDRRHAAILAHVRPMVESRAVPWQKAHFQLHVWQQRICENRWRVDDVSLSEIRMAWSVAIEAGLEVELNFVRAVLGFALVAQGDLTAGRAELEVAFAIAKRRGDTALELTCTSELAWAGLRQHDIALAKDMAGRSEELRHASPPFLYADNIALSVESWVAWKEGRPSEAERLAQESLAVSSAQLQSGEYRRRLDCICLFPLIAVRLADRRTEEAVLAARKLLDPSQMRLPDELEVATEAAIDAWESGDPVLASTKLGDMLELAEDFNLA
jgi:class 3 adenylate cyclase/tetratricopeptide (TPR) repeat protein